MSMMEELAVAATAAEATSVADRSDTDTVSKVADGVGSAMVTVGHVYAWGGLVFSVIIGLILIFFGWTLVSTARAHTDKVSAVVLSASVVTNYNNGQAVKNTNADVQYTYKNKVYKATNVSFPGALTKGSPIDVMVNPNDPSSAIAVGSDGMIGWALIIGSVILMAISGGVVYATYRSKWFSGLFGTYELAKNL